MSLKHKFNYGRCLTDYKDGRSIDVTQRGFDYIYGPEYGADTRELFYELNLPIPDKNEIFRGRYHDLLPIDSHGIILRIGSLEPADMVGPGVLQPLGWISNKDIYCESKPYFINPLTVAIYPGIELMSTKTAEYDWQDLIRQNRGKLRQFGQYFNDEERPHNYGVIRVKGDDGNQKVVPLVLDADNGSIGYNLSSKKTTSKPRLTKLFNRCVNKADVMEMFIEQKCKKLSGMEDYIKAFQVHQPLRRMFWDCYKKNKLDVFFDACAESLAKNGAKNPILFTDWADKSKKPKYKG